MGKHKTKSRTYEHLVDIYLSDIARYPRLTEEEEQEQYKLLLKGDEAAKHILVLSHLKLVVDVAKRYRDHGVSFIELIQQGNCGLLRAAEKFDPTLGFKFGTYAVWWIRGAIYKVVCIAGHPVRIPEKKVKKYSGLSNLTISLSQLEELDANENGNSPITKQLDDGTYDSIVQEAERMDMHRNIMNALDTFVQLNVLSQIELLIILNVYFEDKKFDTVGKEMGISKQRVAQIKQSALNKLGQSVVLKSLHKQLN